MAGNRLDFRHKNNQTPPTHFDSERFAEATAERQHFVQKAERADRGGAEIWEKDQRLQGEIKKTDGRDLGKNKKTGLVDF